MLSRIGEWVYLDGRFVSSERALISPFDRGFLFGDSLIETMRAYVLCLPFCEDHFQRLSSGMELMRFKPVLDSQTFRQTASTLLSRNRMNSACVRFCVTRGPGADITVGDDKQLSPTVFCFLRAVPDTLSAMHKFGIKALSSRDARARETVNLVKSSNYLRNIIGRFEARDAGADDVFFFDSEGCLAESSTSNVFVVKNGRLLTPSPERGTFLPGVTRAKIIALAGKRGIECAEKDVTKKDLERADEIFICNSVVEIVPVAQFDGQPVGDGTLRAEMTRLLHADYQHLVESAITGPDSSADRFPGNPAGGDGS